MISGNKIAEYLRLAFLVVTCVVIVPIFIFFSGKAKFFNQAEVQNESKPVSAQKAKQSAIKPKVEFVPDIMLEAGSAHTLNEFIALLKDGRVINGQDRVNTSKVGVSSNELRVADSDGVEHKFTFSFSVNDTTPPVISVPKSISARKDRGQDLLSRAKVTDNSGEKITASLSGNYNFRQCGTYNLTYTACDSSGNTVSTNTTLTVYIPAVAHSATALRTPANINAETYKLPYTITVYREYNTVVVYTPDEGGHFTVPLHTYVCSAGDGNNTPLGTFYTPVKYRWKVLMGNVYGQYSTRIVDSVLFHSVPYLKQDNTTLKYWLYNKLGEKDSMGCVRLTTADAKWIYDNCELGTAVTVTTDPLPEGINRPESAVIEAESPNRGWDPTDPDPRNPWKN